MGCTLPGGGRGFFERAKQPGKSWNRVSTIYANQFLFFSFPLLKSSFFQDHVYVPIPVHFVLVWFRHPQGTAVHCAILRGHWRIAEYLIKKGAPVDAKCYLGVSGWRLVVLPLPYSRFA